MGAALDLSPESWNKIFSGPYLHGIAFVLPLLQWQEFSLV
jgi:hypothetical protein